MNIDLLVLEEKRNFLLNEIDRLTAMISQIDIQLKYAKARKEMEDEPE